MNTARKKPETFTEFWTNFVLTRNIKIVRWCVVIAKNQHKMTYDREFSIVKSRGLKYIIFLKGNKLDFICMNMKLMKNKKYLQQKFSRKVLVPQTTADFTSRVSSQQEFHVPFTRKFPMVMNFVQTLHRRCRSKTNFYVFSYDKISLKFCASLRFFLAVFMEKIKKIHYLSYVRRGISVLCVSNPGRTARKVSVISLRQSPAWR